MYSSVCSNSVIIIDHYKFLILLFDRRTVWDNNLKNHSVPILILLYLHYAMFDSRQRFHYIIHSKARRFDFFFYFSFFNEYLQRQGIDCTMTYFYNESERRGEKRSSSVIINQKYFLISSYTIRYDINRIVFSR